MHIAIEGMDGAGKTTAAKAIAEKIGFQFVEKPLQLVMDDLPTYIRIVSEVNKRMDGNFKTLFYGAGNYLVSQLAREQNIVTDRHMVSNYYWNYNDNDDLFDRLVATCGIPNITVVLYASPAVRYKRIIARDTHDPDLNRTVFDDSPYERVRTFLERYAMTYLWLDTSEMDTDSVVQTVCDYYATNQHLAPFEKSPR